MPAFGKKLTEWQAPVPEPEELRVARREVIPAAGTSAGSLGHACHSIPFLSFQSVTHRVLCRAGAMLSGPVYRAEAWGWVGGAAHSASNLINLKG